MPRIIRLKTKRMISCTRRDGSENPKLSVQRTACTFNIHTRHTSGYILAEEAVGLALNTEENVQRDLGDD